MSNLKQTFADELMEMLKTKPLDKITVKDISSRCGVSRQSFYYHFTDIYDVVEWIYIQEARRVLDEYSDIDTWQVGYVLLMKWAQKHRPLVLNTCRSIQREYIENFMKRILYRYMIRVVETQAQGMIVNQEQREFVANFYTLALNALTLEWIYSGMKEKPEDITGKVTILIQGNFQRALANFEQENLR